MPLLRSAVFLALLTCAACGETPAPASCALDKVADFPVVMIGRHPTIVIEIDGHPERMLVDTGSGNTLILPATFDRLPTTQTAATPGVYGTGAGGTTQINTAIKEDFQIGSVNLRDEYLFVSDFGFETAPGQLGVDGLLGFDVLQLFDVAFDLPDRLITLYIPQDCSSRQTPWPGDYDIEAFIPRADRLNEPDIAAAIDGKTVVMLLDSGASFSMIMRDTVTANGLTPEATAGTGTGMGIGRRLFTYRRERFGSVTIGAETFPDMWLRVSTRAADPDSPARGLLGEDYLAYHRVFLTNTARTAYLGLTVTAQN